MSSTAQTKISVLIPAYNKERGIVRAVQSVTAQTWKNLEVIVLDDASTDRTAEQVEALCRQDARVRLVRREQNGGTLNARLDAFAASTGDYLLCLDADDTLDPACAETLLKIAERSHAEIVGFSARLLDHGKTAGTVDAVRKELNGKAVFEAAFCDHLYNWSVCLKLFRRDIFQRAADAVRRFYCVSAEDFYFYTVLSFFAGKLVLSGQIFYNYQFTAGITGGSTPDSFRRMATMLDALNAVKDFLRQQKADAQYAEAFRQREKEHFFYLFARWPEMEPAGSRELLEYLNSKYDAESVKQYFSGYFSPALAEQAYASLRNENVFPALPRRTESGGRCSAFRKKCARLLKPESPLWFCLKRCSDRIRWRKYS